MFKLSKRHKNGFTLAELLIVIAIIAVLTAIAIIVFVNQHEKAKQAVDLTNMRQAYSAALLEWMTSSDVGTDTVYYFNGAGVTKQNYGINGYGKSTHDAREFSDTLPCEATGIPNRNNHPGYIIVKVFNDGTIYLIWNGAYAGLNITNSSEYQNLSQQEKLERDIILVNSLQDEFRNMTYGQLKDLLINPNGTLKTGIVKGNLDGYLCITLSYSTIDSAGSVVTGNNKTNIYFKDIFDNVGFDTTLEDSETYVINSVQEKTQTIWINLRISENELKNLNSSNQKWNQRAINSYTYVKSGGATTPEQLKESYRKNQ